MSNKKVSLEMQEFVDIHVSDDKTPLIETALFLGNADEAVLTTETSLEVMIQKFIDANSIPGLGKKSNSLNEKYEKYLLESLDTMIEVLEKAKKKVKKMPKWKKEK